MLPPLTLERTIEKTVREEWGRILASLVSSLKDIQLAEDCLQDAVVSALKHWTVNGLPRSPAGWLITVARRKALDKLRRDKNFSTKESEICYLLELENQSLDEEMLDNIPDKRLEMIFTCCHPALEEKSRIALTLRTLGGLSTDEIATTFLDKHDAMQQRITRAKKKIASSNIPYDIPELNDMPERLASVLRVIYLIFNEGYSATKGKQLLRADLSNEAIRLARIISDLMPQETEVAGLLALMLLHDSRRLARVDNNGGMISLEEQNRARWNKEKVQEGVSILHHNLPKNRLGPYQLQAAISAVHAQSPSWQETDWREISALYELLYDLQPSPVVRINQAIATSYMRSIPEALSLLDEAAKNGKMNAYQPYYAARADLLARSSNPSLAHEHYRKAIELTDNEQEKVFLRKKLEQIVH